jgi:hypothetical protein
LKWQIKKKTFYYCTLTLYIDGASLMYTSVKEEKNCDLIYKYLVHRIYGFPFDTPAYVVDKDSVWWNS